MRNWAGNHTYSTDRVERPAGVEELQELVASAERVKALGSRHSFTDIGDTDGVLVSLERLPTGLTVDAGSGTATIGAGAAYGAVVGALHEQGWALGNLASLPHISVAGAVATGTHGSGDRNASLASSVAALEVVDGRGELRWVRRGDDGFDGCVVSLGALGVVTRLVLDLEPTFDVRQDVYTGLPWDVVLDRFEEVTSDAYSVSLFTLFDDHGVRQVWRKSRVDSAPTSFFGAVRATEPVHMLAGATTEAVTDQSGVVGPWLERLPHFRMEFTPSRGEELQTEYLVPRHRAVEAVMALRTLAGDLAPLLQVAELRTVAAEPLWLSGSFETDTVGFHCTWLREPEAVYAVLPRMEELLLPLGARPHWGKCFVAAAEQLDPLYPRMGDFRALRSEWDPDGTFDNAYLRRVIG
jgi:alditol oxidase